LKAAEKTHEREKKELHDLKIEFAKLQEKVASGDIEDKHLHEVNLGLAKEKEVLQTEVQFPCTICMIERE